MPCSISNFEHSTQGQIACSWHHDTTPYRQRVTFNSKTKRLTHRPYARIDAFIGFRQTHLSSSSIHCIQLHFPCTCFIVVLYKLETTIFISLNYSSRSSTITTTSSTLTSSKLAATIFQSSHNQPCSLKFCSLPLWLWPLACLLVPSQPVVVSLLSCVALYKPTNIPR